MSKVVKTRAIRRTRVEKPTERSDLEHLEIFIQAYNNMEYKEDPLTYPGLIAYTLHNRKAIWPIFLSSKTMQTGENLHRFAHRTFGMDQNESRVMCTLDTLAGADPEARSVTWVGCSGVGKSTDMNYILLLLLADLKDVDNDLGNVMLYINRRTYVFERDETSGRLRVTAVPGEGMDTLVEYSRQFTKEGSVQSVAVIELTYDETLGDVRVPFLVAMSARKLDPMMRLQSQNTQRLIIEPWNRPDLEAMLRFLFADADDADRERRTDLALKRFEQVGGNLRVVLSPGSHFFATHLREVESMVNLYRNEFDKIHDADPFHAPPRMHYIATMYLKPDCIVPRDVVSAEEERDMVRRFRACLEADTTETPGAHEEKVQEDTQPAAGYIADLLALPETPETPDIPNSVRAPYVWKFLSPWIAAQFSTREADPKEIEVLRQYGLEFQVAQAMVKHALLDSGSSVFEMPRGWDASRWEVYWDPGCHCKVYAEMRMSIGAHDLLPRATGYYRFSGMFMRQKPPEFEETVTLHDSTNSDMAVSDYNLVDKDRQNVSFIQVSSSDATLHGFKTDTIATVLDSMGLKDDREWRITLVYVTGMDRDLHGVKFILPETDNDPAIGISLSDWKWVERENPDHFVHRMTTYVIRARIFSGTQPAHGLPALADLKKPDAHGAMRSFKNAARSLFRRYGRHRFVGIQDPPANAAQGQLQAILTRYIAYDAAIGSMTQAQLSEDAAAVPLSVSIAPEAPAASLASTGEVGSSTDAGSARKRHRSSA